MDLMRGLLAAMGFDCSRRAKSTAQSSQAEVTVVHVARKESSPQTCSLSLDLDTPHCQSCISYEARLQRLVCGHFYCDQCRGCIINQAFKDIEGLSDYPCPMCNSIRQLGGTVPEPRLCSNSPPTVSVGFNDPSSPTSSP
ncbi:unnamed protein product [Coregonus sp. 'balchen']|uniref:RING-type domain-containing protein n=1 Tax=Coregonus suidteri TaxID=861788 RepID=A0AAN8R3S1_9TELE|nr:unnamed protein product [Coregonus sp. 'balchen']